MKKTLCALVLAVALPATLLAWENSPSCNIIIPEVVWAAATGGGTWTTEIQITDANSSTDGGAIVTAYFTSPGGGYRSVTIWTSPGWKTSAKWTNILAAMQALDPAFTYYGHSGALWLGTQGSSYLISAVARTYNGNYGKTFPGLQWTDSNTANIGRRMMIMNVIRSSEYRTFAGFFNAIAGEYSMTCRMEIVDANWSQVGNSWDETFAPYEYKAFNIFTKAGITSGTYENHWLFIDPQTSGSSGEGTKGLFCFGSIASNTTNDTYAIIAVQFGPWSSAGLLARPGKDGRSGRAAIAGVTFM
ncbi:MAG: hypothetical protein OEW05_11060 [Candidatus Aminicenantes bacterium]|nr:hypothetical protein [Candidatus Aminicenantes bacterium]